LPDDILQLTDQERRSLYSQQLDRARVLELAERLLAATPPEARERAVRIDG